MRTRKGISNALPTKVPLIQLICRLISIFEEHWSVKGQTMFLEIAVSHSITGNLNLGKQNIYW